MVEQQFSLAAILGAGDALADLVAEIKDSVVLVRAGRMGAGSGIVWRADGIIMTNHHVVARGNHASVLFNNNRELKARVIARDPALDLAALKIEQDELPVARIGTSQHTRVGELVLAVGNPWGQRGVVTAGIVSAIGEIEVAWRRSKAEYIRSDVQLAPGNSGGPMLNARGEVIGINAMIFGGDLGVAIPGHIATQFLLVAEGQPPVLGVGVQPVVLPGGSETPAGRDHGLLVVQVQPGSAADRGGLYLGDVLLDVAGKSVAEPHALQYVLAEQLPGSQLAIRLIRGGVVRSLELQLDAVADLQVAT